MDKAEEQRIQLVEAGEDAAVPLQAPKQAFHFVAPLIALGVVRPGRDRDIRGGTTDVKPTAKAKWRVVAPAEARSHHDRQGARLRASAPQPVAAGRDIARPAGQREAAVRFWLRLDADDPLPSAADVETLFTAVLDTLDPELHATAKANVLVIARGGESRDYLF